MVSEQSGTATAAVIGGGLAGISAAVALADRGWRVTLLEERPRLGGMAYSFERAGVTVDTGVHVILRCYSCYRSLLARMGVGDRVRIQDRMSIAVLGAGGRASRLVRGRIGPAPVHLLRAVAGYRELSVRERLSTVRAAVAARNCDPDDPELDRTSFGEWLSRHGQRRHATSSLWGLLCVAALNADPEHASAALMMRVLRTGLLERVDSGDIAVPGAPLSALHDEPARALLGALGVTVRMGTRATSIEPAAGGYVVGTSAGPVRAAAVVVAVPHRQATGLVPAGASPDRERWADLGSSPIVNVHLRFDRPVTGDALAANGFAAVVGSPLQWVFDRTSAAGVPGQYLVISMSAADVAVRRRAAELLEMVRAEFGRLFPASQHAALLDDFVTREPHATFRQQPGSGALRPAAETLWSGLVLAGAWTNTGLPDTLEGAVYSGRLAACALGGVAGRARGGVVAAGGRARGQRSIPDPSESVEVVR